MDEPLGTLDADQRLAMRELIRTEQLASNVTTIYVTHDQEEAMSLADRIVVMEGGRIRQVGAPAEIYDRPADRFVATFVGSPGMNLVAGQVVPAPAAPIFVSEAGQVRIALPHAARPGAATLGIRAEHLHEDPGGPIAGRVLAEEYLGNASNLHLDTALGRLVMRTRRPARLPRGAELRLRLDADRISVFDAATEQRL
jgi:ABC-type sugar transport system ATPase subunit